LAALALSALALAAGPAWGQATCNPQFSLGYAPGGDPFAEPGSVYTVILTLGAGEVLGGTEVRIETVRFNLDCADPDTSIDCADDGDLISYSGNLSDTCAGVVFSASHTTGDTDPNQVVFDADVTLDIPAGNTTFCQIQFDVTVEERDGDGVTPNVIEQSGGYRNNGADATCDNDLANSAQSTGSIPTCPACDDGLFCNGEETCNQETGACIPGDPVICTDGLFCNGNEECVEETDTCSNPPDVVCTDGLFCNGVEECDEGTDSCTNPPDVVCDDEATCTSDLCDEGIDDCVFTPDNTDCDDQDVCTDNICDPEDPTADAVTGCTFPEDTTDPDESCLDDFACRTCGFWGNHPALTQQLLDDGNIAVCGGPQQTNTDPEDPASANEAICVKVQGHQHRQLARQLTCLALNCQFNGAGEDCEGATAGGQDLAALFLECDSVCADAADDESNTGVGSCIDRVDCINNGGTPVETDPGEWTCAGGECSIDGELCGFDEGDCAPNACVDGTCTLGGDPCTVTADCTDTQVCELFEAQNCHQLDLCPEDGEFCFEPPGRATPADCKASNKSTCTYSDLDCP
jgi:hypothetical protein